MKKIMKVVSLILTFALMVGMAIPSTAIADDLSNVVLSTTPTNGKITLNPQGSGSLSGHRFMIFKILAITSSVEGANTYALPFNQDPDGTMDGKTIAPDGSYNYQIRQDLIEAVNAGHTEDEENKVGDDANLQEILTHLRSHANGAGPSGAEMLGENAKIEGFAKEMLKKMVTVSKDTDYTVTVNAPYNITGILTEKTADDSSVVFDDLPYGYYLVYDATEPVSSTDGEGYPVSALIMLNADSNSESIDVKSTLPTLDKKIAEGEVKADDATVGDYITFQLDTVLPSAVGFDTFTYKITDKLSKGLAIADKAETKVYGTSSDEYTSFNQDQLTITIGGHDFDTSSSELIEASAKAGDPDGVELTIDLADLAKAVANNVDIVGTGAIDTQPKVGDEIVIKYNARITDDAKIKTATTNTASLQYSNAPDGTVNGTTTDTETYTYTYGLKIKKENTKDKALRGAEFVISKTVKGSEVFAKAKLVGSDGNPTGTAIKGIPPKYLTDGVISYEDADGKLKVAGETYVVSEWVSLQSDATVFVTTGVDPLSEATVQINGLGDGDYTLKEVKSYIEDAEGNKFYNLDPDGVKFTITSAYGTNNKPSRVDYTLDKAYNSVKGSAELGDLDFNEPTYNSNNAAENGYATITILNSEREPLPETGGMGTTMIYVVGGALIVIAGVLLISKRRMGATR